VVQRGEHVGRYRLDEVVGRGGMAVVWRATDTLLDRVVALKHMRLDHLDEAHAQGARPRVVREARLAARLHHPAAVTVFDVVEHDGDLWLVLEYVPSRSLAEIVDADGALAPAEAARIGVVLADALSAAHAAGIVHRDVKPANVLVGASGAVKLTDFGIARAAGDLTLTASGVLIGTPAYMAPEVAAGDDAVPASDVFGLGATLYAAVEGVGPYGPAGTNMLALLRAVAEGRIRPPQDAGPLTEALLAMLRVDPAERPDARRAGELLERVTGEPEPRSTDPTVPAEPGPRPTASTVLAAPADAPTAEIGRGRRVVRRSVIGGAAALLSLALVVALVIASMPGAPEPSAAAEGSCDTSKGRLIIGMIAPLTGGIAGLGRGMRNSAQLAVDQANEACAVPGYELVFQPEDDKSKSQVAEEAAAKLASDPNVVGVIGTMYSGTARPVQPILHLRAIAMISPSNPHPSLTMGENFATAPQRPFDNYFRLSATDLLQGPFAANYLVRTVGKQRIAVIDDGKSWGAGLAEGFAQQATKLGAQVVARERVAEDETDFSGVIAAIRGQNPDAVFYGGYYTEAGRLSAQLAVAGLNIPLMGGDGIHDDDFISFGGRPGDLVTSFGAPAEALPGARQYVSDYAAAGFAEPYGLFGISTYDAANVLIRALTGVLAEGDYSEDRRTDIVAAVQATDMEGVSGRISFDEFGDNTNKMFSVFTVSGAAFDWVEGSTADFEG
jgi:branched-chain amino acid transport system substrate-binding protein